MIDLTNYKTGDIDLSDTDIVELPPNISHVRGDLKLTNSKIKKLPEKLTVTGSMVIRNCPLQKLPEYLRVEEILAIDENSPINEIPKHLKMGEHGLIKCTLSNFVKFPPVKFHYVLDIRKNDRSKEYYSMEEIYADYPNLKE